MKSVPAASSTKGFTLAELSITLVLISLMALYGISGWQRIAGRIHILSSTNKLIHAVYNARSHAMISGSEVVLCPTSDGENCQADRSWENGWMVFRNDDGDSPPQPDAGEPVLQIAGASAHLQINANRAAFIIRPFGLRSTNGTLVFCGRNRITPPRALIISYTGKPRTSSAPARGDSLSCA